jgi:asparagine synthase (glutamine-hydrolysing)
MCGITGIYYREKNGKATKELLEKMVCTLHHRGPDEKGFHISRDIGLAQSRLSIIDLAGGKQPIYNEDKSVCVIFNGEIFNYIELSRELKNLGHRFSTQSDTEVIVHAYEEYGLNFLDHFNGQFAIALWDERKKELILARDRVGIRPLFYALDKKGRFIFASEMKAILATSYIEPEIDPAGINQIFTLWVNIPPCTVFKNINELPPAHYMRITPEKTTIHRYWKLSFPGKDDYDYTVPFHYYREKLNELIYNAVTIRLRADVPVASYLSGGIDSSIITALVKKYHNNDLITFSVAFEDKHYDESSYQQQMVKFLNTDHRIVTANYGNIGSYFPEVIKYAEKPLIRTAPAPLFILSKLVRENNIKVVLTGEGADEVFGGYNIFKEDKIRRFWAKFPESRMRPELLNSIYPYINNNPQSKLFWQLFFKKQLTKTDNPYYSHLLRWENTSYIKRFFNKDFTAQFDDTSQIYDPLDNYLDPDMIRWHPLSRAQYLEMVLFMSGYLLSSQGDRMMMGNSVEGRFPYLDYQVIEFANTIPPGFKMNVLNEKYILKKCFEHLLPASVVQRAKQPYRAPIYQCFLGESESNLSYLFDSELIKKYGYFNPGAVNRLISKAHRSNGEPISIRDDMAMVGIASLQLLHAFYLT